MQFTWPLALALLLVAPLVLGAYLWKLRRRRKQAVTYSSVALLRSVIPKGSRRRRHIPAALLVAALCFLSVAAARPQMTRKVSLARTSIILALDVSRSMCATDVDPNRLTAAKDAAKDFVARQATGTRTGLVVFSGSAQLVVPPTTDRKALTKAIDELTTGLGTAIGAAMLKSLDAIAEVNPNVTPIGNVAITPSAGGGGFGATPSTTPDPTTTVPTKNGTYVPDIVVLLTDGANNRGIAPLDAVPYAVERRVRVYTIGFGTTQPAPLVCTAQDLGGTGQGGGFGFGGGGGGFGGGGGGFGGGRSPLRADLPTLKQVADETGGQAYTAQDAPQLRKVFDNLPKDVAVQKEKHEVSAFFVAIGALLALAAVAASIRWSAYP
jgi:Ca-activated chloride channel family protein